jgi:hypothetical protein
LFVLVTGNSDYSPPVPLALPWSRQSVTVGVQTFNTLHRGETIGHAEIRAA